MPPSSSLHNDHRTVATFIPFDTTFTTKEQLTAALIPFDTTLKTKEQLQPLPFLHNIGPSKVSRQ